MTWKFTQTGLAALALAGLSAHAGRALDTTPDGRDSIIVDGKAYKTFAKTATASGRVSTWYVRIGDVYYKCLTSQATCEPVVRRVLHKSAHKSRSRGKKIYEQEDTRE